jgi:hypothetical protein
MFYSHFVDDILLDWSLTEFDEQHARDPNKTYAEQLADFSRTPVGAASLSGQYLLIVLSGRIY